MGQRRAASAEYQVKKTQEMTAHLKSMDEIGMDCTQSAHCDMRCICGCRGEGGDCIGELEWYARTANKAKAMG